MIAHTRGDEGLNFWVLLNNGTGFNDPVLWFGATNIDNSARLYAAKLNADAFTDIIAVDNVPTVPGIRIDSYLSNGLQFSSPQPQQTFSQFDLQRSRSLLQSSAVGRFLSDLWLLTPGPGGRNFMMWQLTWNGAGFGGPTLRRAVNTAWSDVKPYATPDGKQFWLPYQFRAR